MKKACATEASSGKTCREENRIEYSAFQTVAAIKAHGDSASEARGPVRGSAFAPLTISLRRATSVVRRKNERVKKMVKRKKSKRGGPSNVRRVARLQQPTMRTCARYVCLSWPLRSTFQAAAPAIFPLKRYPCRPARHRTNRLFRVKIEEFQVEILGVLENIGPRESIILAQAQRRTAANDRRDAGHERIARIYRRKTGGRGRAGVSAVERSHRRHPADRRNAARGSGASKTVALRSAANASQAGNQRLEEIATPVSFSGFTAATLEHFSKQLHDLGLDPRQGVSGGGASGNKMGDPARLQPGSMISVQLVSGDMGRRCGRDGDDDRRQPYLRLRVTVFWPAARRRCRLPAPKCLTLVPNLSASFKISAAREWMGSITEDRNTAVSGVLGRRASPGPARDRSGANASTT